MDRRSEDRPPALRPAVEAATRYFQPVSTAEHAQTLPKPVPGALFRWVKLASWFELGLFAALLFFWLVPGYHSQTSLFGLLHGVGYLGLCALIIVALMRREAPWPLFAATLTPVGPAGTVIGIELIERRGWGIASADGHPRDKLVDTAGPNGE
jgi:hypothetical protein